MVHSSGFTAQGSQFTDKATTLLFFGEL